MNTYMRDLLAIPWNKKSTASGNADKVPGALMGLTSSDEAIRKKSYWQLDNHIVLQSNLYEAAYLTTPFLIRMLSDRVSHGRIEIYDLLYEIANGSALETDICETLQGEVVPLKDGCHQEVLRGYDIFIRDQNDEDANVASRASELVELLKGKKGRSSKE